MAVVMLLILATMMLPEEVLAIPLSVVLADVPPFHADLIGSYAGMVLPVELEEAARLDGAGELRTFLTIILPLCRPALGVIGVFGFTMIWDQYLLPLIVATEPGQWTLPIALRSLRSDEEAGIGVLLAASLLALLPSIIAFPAFPAAVHARADQRRGQGLTRLTFVGSPG
jgi:multiple sugar transport system permease protein